LKAAGLWDRWPLRPADLDALRTVQRNGQPALAHHLTEIAPATDFTLTLGGLQLIFASTGSDVLPQWRNLERVRRGLFLKSLPSTWRYPNSAGLDDQQVEAIARSLSTARGAAVFFHAPLLHGANGAAVDHWLSPEELARQDDVAHRVALEKRLSAAGLRSGVLFRNPGPLLRALASAPGPLVTFSGHVHRATAIELDRRRLSLRSAPLQPPRSAQDTVTLLTAPALGQRGKGENGSPGYLLATFEDGALVGLERRTLATYSRSV
jgi:hypothetical protein